MDRYKMTKGDEEPLDEIITKAENPEPEYIEKNLVLVCFDPEDAVWFIKIKRGASQQWELVKVKRIMSTYSTTTRRDFNTKSEAVEWCKQKGLI